MTNTGPERIRSQKVKNMYVNTQQPTGTATSGAIPLRLRSLFAKFPVVRRDGIRLVVRVGIHSLTNMTHLRDRQAAVCIYGGKGYIRQCVFIEVIPK